MACNEGVRALEPATGPPLRVISTYPASGAGFDCSFDEPECGVPLDVTFEVRFDRYLLPSTAVRQSFFVYTGDPSNLVPPGDDLPVLSPEYDPIERVVSYELPHGVLLEPNTHYTAELVVPLDSDDFGFRAFDFAPLDAETTTKFSFLTSNRQKEPLPAEAAGTCADVVQTFGDHCAGATCHVAIEPAMALDLSGADALALSAIGRVAHQADTGPKTGVPLQNPARFGVGMPRIDPGRPDNSYLMYKLVTAPENYWHAADEPDLCASRHLAAVDPDVCVPATAEENERLRGWFLQGSPMPRADENSAPSWLVRSELRALESWIRSGAPCP